MNGHDRPYEFETSLRWERRLLGELRTNDASVVPVDAAIPYGGQGGRWSPESLLVAAIESATMVGFLAQARRRSIAVLAYRSTSTGVVGPEEHGTVRLLEVVIRPRVILEAAADRELVQGFFQSAAQTCRICASIDPAPRIEAVVEIGPRAPGSRS